MIHEAIKMLPDKARVVFNLYLLEGYMHKEIAEVLEISESTSKSQYRRACKLLQEELKEMVNSKNISWAMKLEPHIKEIRKQLDVEKPDVDSIWVGISNRWIIR